MGKMQVWRTQPAPVFNTICLDLFGPMLIRDNVIKRTGRRVVEGKCWGMVMTCAATGACESCDGCSVAVSRVYYAYQTYLNNLFAATFKTYSETMFDRLHQANLVLEGQQN